MNVTISVIICTYNRAELLKHCLNSCARSVRAVVGLEFLVIDNNSNDHTNRVVMEMSTQIPNLRYIVESSQGLSYARNRAIVEAKGEYVYYVDDDVLLDSDFLINAQRIIAEVQPLIFGGPFTPWYHYGRPMWFQDRYASSDLTYSTRRVLPRGKFLTGCNFCVHKSLFERFGRFDTRLGMRGGLVGYGEETELQREIQNAGVEIWFDPQLKMDHVVNPERLSVDWYIQSGWALGRDRVLSGKVSRSKFYLVTVLVVGVTLTAITGIVCGFKLLLRPNYYIENWWIDTFRKAAKRAAILYTSSLRCY